MAPCGGRTSRRVADRYRVWRGSAPRSRAVGHTDHCVSVDPALDALRVFGEQIGRDNPVFETLTDIIDVNVVKHVKTKVEASVVCDPDRGWRRTSGGDNAWTPMQWTDGERAGITDASPDIG